MSNGGFNLVSSSRDFFVQVRARGDKKPIPGFAEMGFLDSSAVVFYAPSSSSGPLLMRGATTSGVLQKRACSCVGVLLARLQLVKAGRTGKEGNLTQSTQSSQRRRNQILHPECLLLEGHSDPQNLCALCDLCVNSGDSGSGGTSRLAPQRLDEIGQHLRQLAAHQCEVDIKLFLRWQRRLFI
jgi:hypothetical protein